MGTTSALASAQNEDELIRYPMIRPWLARFATLGGLTVVLYLLHLVANSVIYDYRPSGHALVSLLLGYSDKLCWIVFALLLLGAIELLPGAFRVLVDAKDIEIKSYWTARFYAWSAIERIDFVSRIRTPSDHLLTATKGVQREHLGIWLAPDSLGDPKARKEAGQFRRMFGCDALISNHYECDTGRLLVEVLRRRPPSPSQQT